MKKLMALAIIAALFLGARASEPAPVDVTADIPAAGMPSAAPDSVLTARAQAGDPEAMNYLGYLLLSGEEGVARDPGAGLSWLVKAASGGDAKAASNLGWLLIEGDLVEQDLEEGARWLAKASGQGLPVAQSLLGDLYRDGRGVARDTAVADSLYRLAFERGLADAGYKLYALNSEEYKNLPPERKVAVGKYYYLRGAAPEGVKLFYLASDEGSPEAMALLGDAYSRAIGVPYDHDLSKAYFVKAALAGNPSAQFIVGELLDIFPDTLAGADLPEEGMQTPAYWYEKASAGGVGDAAEAMRLMLGE